MCNSRAQVPYCRRPHLDLHGFSGNHPVVSPCGMYFDHRALVLSAHPSECLSVLYRPSATVISTVITRATSGLGPKATNLTLGSINNHATDKHQRPIHCCPGNAMYACHVTRT